ncbi:hypothetical protein, partial [Paenibacillus alba]|uniref:hypothetical protein n=1 Tax=Paenibacillus alba TaxID=1197127 RepID=UPI001C204429
MKTEQRVSKHERAIVQKKRLQNLASKSIEHFSFQIYGQVIVRYNGEFDPGSGRTLAACLI